MKECELCSAPARMYCESDQASLCWDCDSKVHCANFLVARHSRSLLCHACQSVTPWQATGAKLGPTVSVCEGCVKGKGREGRGEERGGGVAEEESHGGNELEEDDDGDGDGSGDDDDDDDDDGSSSSSDGGDGNRDDDDDEDGENQVVPWTSTPPPPIASCSSSEESSSRFCSSSGARVSHSAVASSLKRMRENADLGSQDDLRCASSSHQSYEEAISFASIRPLKERKRALILTTTTKTTTRTSETDSCSSASVALMSSLRRLEDDDTPSAILHICKLSQDPSTAVDLLS